MRAFSRCELNWQARPVTVILALILFIIPALSFAEGPYRIDWFTIDGGGGTSSGGPYTLTATIGQPDAGGMSGGQYKLFGGFWPAGLISDRFPSTYSTYNDWLALGKACLLVCTLSM